MCGPFSGPSCLLFPSQVESRGAGVDTAVCQLTGTWQSYGSNVPVIVIQYPNNSFIASAQSAWQNVAGMVYANGTVFLKIDGGIFGALNAGCSWIAWNDGVGSEWYDRNILYSWICQSIFRIRSNAEACSDLFLE